MVAISEDYAAQGGIREGNCWRWRDPQGRVHRDGDLPAVIHDDGQLAWYQHGNRHRDGDRPAIIGASGCYKEWCIQGQTHRDNGPAEKHSDGVRVWRLNGKFHRIGGPAIEDPNDSIAWQMQDDDPYWYVNGKGFINGDDDEYKEACLEYISTHGGRLTKGRLGT